MNLVQDVQRDWITSRSEPAAQGQIVGEDCRWAGKPFPKQFYLALQNSRRQTVALKPVDVAGEATFEDLPAGKYAILVFFSDQAIFRGPSFVCGSRNLRTRPQRNARRVSQLSGVLG